MDAPQAQVFVETVEIGQSANQLALVPPVACRETFGDRRHSYLAPYPARRARAKAVAIVRWMFHFQAVATKCAWWHRHACVRIKAPQHFVQNYSSHERVPRALTAAGWTLVFRTSKRAPNEPQIITRWHQEWP